MSLHFYSKNEDLKNIESIEKYKAIFKQYKTQNINLRDALNDMLISNNNTREKSKELTEEILYFSERIVINNFIMIKERYPYITKEQSIIIASYSYTSSDIENSPYIILNKNLCEANKEKGVKNISKYFYLFLTTLRKLNRFYPDKKYLYRNIATQVDIKENIFNKNKIPYSRGKMKIFWGFTSTSTQIRKTLCINGENIDFTEGTLFTLYGNNWGYDISFFNEKMNEEIILEPEIKGIVINVVPPINNNKIINIRLQIENDRKLFELTNNYGNEICSEDKFKIKYTFNKNDLRKNSIFSIQIFGENFVYNNRKICKYIYKHKSYPITKTFPINDLNENELEIELIGIKNAILINDMFKDCKYLSYISNLSKINISKYENISSLFKNCSFLSYLPDIAKWDVSKVNDMSYMFDGCSALKKLPDISKWNTKNVKYMSGVFHYCKSLIKLPDIELWNTSNVVDISEMFSCCGSLTFLPDISKWDVSKVIYMFNLFNGCKSLLYLPDISKWEMSNVKSIYAMFNNCKSLSILPDISKWKINDVESLSYMFNNFISLSYIPDITKWSNDNISDISNLFSNCISLSYIPKIFVNIKKSLNVKNNFSTQCISLLNDFDT